MKDVSITPCGREVTCDGGGDKVRGGEGGRITSNHPHFLNGRQCTKHMLE